MIRLLLALAIVVVIGYPLGAADRPNVLMIVSDDLGFADLGCTGSEVATPTLDGLARDGLLFTQFYNTGRCWPTRAAMLTGYYAQMVRRDTLEGVPSGTRGKRPAFAKLLPERLAALGYTSFHSGKWHLDGLPLKTGFARSYRIDDHDRHFAPRAHFLNDQKLPPATTADGYYSSTAVADHTLKFLREHEATAPEKPFFGLVAFTAPHFPVQAPGEDVAKYRSKYDAGWDALRQARFDRQSGLNLNATLAPVERDLGPPYAFPDDLKKLGPGEVNRPLEWASLTLEQRHFQAGKMAVHAAMVDRMDAEIGRIVAHLKSTKKFDDTLILFFSDNGASAELMVRGDGHDPHAECGTAATFLSIGPGWSGACNTPFRRHKTWVHEGGTRTPLVISWPKRLAGRSGLRSTPSHVVDLVPTILELAGGKLDGPPSPGRSLVPVLEHDKPELHETIWWLHEQNRALRHGDLKIVASGKGQPWELYDLKADPTERVNLADRQPDAVAKLAALWDAETAQATQLAGSGGNSPKIDR